MLRTKSKMFLVLAVLALNQTFIVKRCDADAICPHTYLFAIDGLHYYSAVKCEPTPCKEVLTSTLLAYNQRIRQFGCEQTDSDRSTPDCKCRTVLVPVGSYDSIGDLSQHYDDKQRVFIRNDHFVAAQIDNRRVYFRTLTFVANKTTGGTEERSIAMPIDTKSMTAIMQNGLNGNPVTVYQSTFDGWNVVLGGKQFRAMPANRSTASYRRNEYSSR